METIKENIIRILREKGASENTIKEVSQLSDERIQWFKDVAWNLARITNKYDRESLYKDLPHAELMVLLSFEAEETIKWSKEMKNEHQEFLRKLRQMKVEKASASLNYIFPIGEA